MSAKKSRKVLLQEILEALDEVDVAEAALRERLRAYRSITRRARRYFERNGTTPGFVEQERLVQERTSTTDAFDTFEAARLRVQHALYRLGEADGMNAAEIGRASGVSRQLVSRVLNAT
jgi:hypothetical protein